MNTTNDAREKIEPQPAFRPSADLLIWAIIAIQIMVAVYGFAVLSNIVPIHWGINGQANGYGAKWLVTFFFPFISVGIYGLLRGLMAIGPRLGGAENTAANLPLLRIILTSITLFLLIVQLSALVQTLGAPFNTSMVVMLGLSVLYLFLGNYMGKIRRNFWIGIRTPWTLANEVVWARTHRLGGWLFVAVGLIGIPLSFIPVLRLWGVVVPLIAVLIILCVYSYVCYQQQVQGGYEPLSPPFDGGEE